MEYLITILIFGIIPPSILLYYAKNHIHWKTLYLSVITAITVGTFWDYIAIKRGIWSYGLAGKTIGITLFSIPIEDFLFFSILPLWGIGFYEFIKNKLT